ncbi:MAG: maleylpyruvate isomerase family mycothiol-dependent enzyme [Actinobacteria bacterium]|nr:maleylpyruvate isomerase family mycothiol-dependent enzyme [Actinomycetota bacterium]
MEPSQHLAAVRSDGARLLDAARAAGWSAPVPSCPGWTVADLLGHVGQVQRWQADLIARRVQAPEFAVPEAPTDPAVLVDWVAEATADLLAVLDATDPDVTLWTFTGPGPAAFWFRRQAHETALHRVDAELAAGIAPEVDAELARDGIDEFLDLVVGGLQRDRVAGAGETIHLHRTDGAGEWLVRRDPDGARVTREHAKGDVAARGSASDLLLAVRGRIGPDRLEVFGDAAVLERFVADAAR